jgi:hypothetical protein
VHTNKRQTSFGHIKPFQVWRKIAEEMAAKGYEITGLQCDKNFRSLKYRYVYAFFLA